MTTTLAQAAATEQDLQRRHSAACQVHRARWAAYQRSRSAVRLQALCEAEADETHLREACIKAQTLVRRLARQEEQEERDRRRAREPEQFSLFGA